MNHGGGRAVDGGSLRIFGGMRRERNVDIVSVRLPDSGSVERRKLELQLEEPFRPFAFLVWGARVPSKVRDILVNGEGQMLSTLPAFMFESEIDFAEFERLLAPRFERDAYPALSAASFAKVGHIFELSMPSLSVAEKLAVDIEGPIEHAVFLGNMWRPTPEVRTAS